MPHDELLAFYEGELNYLRQMGADFAERYPKIASRLLLEPHRCEDPQVERMIESFALLAARIQAKIHDDFPELTQALFGIVYPHYIRPIPSMTVVQFHLDPEQTSATSGVTIPRGTMLYTHPVSGTPLKFQTSYDTVLWPIAVEDVQWTSPDRLDPPLKSWDACAALRIGLRCQPEVTFDQLDMPALRLFLNGEGLAVHTLYELLANNCVQVLLRERRDKPKPRTISIPAEQLRPVGFAPEESALPYPKRSFEAYRLLQEYFALPEKFFFFDLHGTGQLLHSGIGERLDLIFLISPFERADRIHALETGISESTFCLGCSPAVNLFPHTAEPILVDQARHEYPVIPDVRRPNELEIYSVDSVVCATSHSDTPIQLEPLYSHRHGPMNGRQNVCWCASRRTSMRPRDENTEVFLSLVDRAGLLAEPDFDTLTVRTTCTNRELPYRLSFGMGVSDFELDGPSAVKRILALKRPTNTVRPPLGSSAFWRLVSHLSLNYLSLVEEGKEAFQEILKLYDFSESAYLGKQIEGITKLASRREFAPVVSENGISFVQGTRVDIEFDEDQFVGGGVFLFASILETFLGLYAGLNSFSQLSARTRQRKEVLKEWPPRSGHGILL